MNIEQRIKAIKNFAEVENPQSLLPDLAKQSLEVINHLQSEVDRYKHLWETNAEESKEIIAELKLENEKRMKAINHYIKICDYVLPKNEILRANILDSINLEELPPKQNH